LGTRSTGVFYTVSLCVLALVVYDRGSLNFGSTVDTLLLGTVRMVVSFLAGVLTCGVTGYLSNRNANIFTILITLAFVVGFLSFSPSGWRAEYDLCCVAIVFPGLILFLSTMRVNGTVRSFPLYMVHVPLLTIGAFVVIRLRSKLLIETVPVLTVCLLVTISHFAFHWFDDPVRRFLTFRFLKR
jgi:peptidoglycan/LPS O-acetylase OafA/YrhL